MKNKKLIISLGVTIIILVGILISTLLFRKDKDLVNENVPLVKNNEYLEKLAIEIQKNHNFENSTVLVDKDQIIVNTTSNDVIYSTTFSLIDNILVYEFPGEEQINNLKINDEVIWKLKDIVASLQDNSLENIKAWNASANFETMNIADNGISLLRSNQKGNQYIISFEISINNLKLNSAP